MSVVLATRDRPALLRRALDAIRAQDHPGTIECLVVFDQAPPEADLVDTDPTRSVRVLTNDRTPGLAGARNTGLLAATGELVGFCDDDDEWLPGKLATQIAALDRAPEAVLATTGIVVVTRGQEVGRVPPVTSVTFTELVRSRVTGTHPSSYLGRRERLLREVGLVDEDLPGGYGEDWDWLLRAAAVHDVVVVPEALVRVHWHGGSYFTERWAVIDGALAYLAGKHPALGTDRVGAARLSGQRAFARAALGDRRGARRLARAALRKNVREPRAYLALAVSTGVVGASGIQRALNSMGRGI